MPEVFDTVKQYELGTNPGDRHGKTGELSKQELDDLLEFLFSL